MNVRTGRKTYSLERAGELQLGEQPIALVWAILVAVALLALGEVAVGALPARLTVGVDASTVHVDMEGVDHVLALPGSAAGGHLRFVEPGPVDREYQIDGSDTTTREDRDRAQFRALADVPWYRLFAWLRDEGSYGRWNDVRMHDYADGRVLAGDKQAVESTLLPASFQLEAALRRPEARPSIAIEGPNGAALATLTVDRHQHRVEWKLGDDDDPQSTWFFPTDPWPFAAELLQLAGRSAAAAVVLVAIMFLVGAAAQRTRVRIRHVAPPAVVLAAGMCVIWLAAAIWVSVRLYHQLPHIVDAEAYLFQARILQTGRTWLETPDIVDQLDGFQQIIWNNRWFSQYPPGAPALYALGGLAGLQWLVGPVAGLTTLVAIGITGCLLFDRTVALIALGLTALSPFFLFQSGAFMSHPVAAAAVAVALGAFAYAWRTRNERWYLVTGLALGYAFDTREIAAVIYGIAFAIWLIAHRHLKPCALLGLGMAPFVAAYLAFNLSTTGDLFALPRTLFNAKDKWGFGDVGPSGMHTFAAGLVNTDENLTLLQFDLYGWPPLAAFALLSIVFLTRRARRFDYLLAGCAGGFVLAYIGYFYQGVALGPRYYFEALPALALLSARGVRASLTSLEAVGLARRFAAVGCAVVLCVLTVYSLVFYLPNAVQRRMDYGALSHGRRLALPFVESTLGGPRLSQVVPPALVLVQSDDVFKSISALNCPLLDREHITDCPVLMVRAGTDQLDELTSQFPGRTVWVIEAHGDLVTLDLARRADHLESAG